MDDPSALQVGSRGVSLRLSFHKFLSICVPFSLGFLLILKIISKFVDPQWVLSVSNYYVNLKGIQLI